MPAPLISTRTPHAGSDDGFGQAACAGFISTRTPHAGSDKSYMAIKYGRLISTRTPHAGSDGTGADIIKASDEFQPALPMRGVTDLGGRRLYVYEISTRTPHAGSDRTRRS